MKNTCIGFILMTGCFFVHVVFLRAEDGNRKLLDGPGERLRLIRSKVAHSARSWLFQPEVNALTSSIGYSYVTHIPFVTREDGTRTNLGLNNFSQLSFVKGANPSANVRVLLIDHRGFIAGEGNFVVRSNEMLQINDIISALGGAIDTGWLDIFSDEPLTAWASVIINSTNDPSIELATRFGYRRLMIQSSVRTDAYQSSLVIVNLGSASGNVAIKIYDHDGQQIGSKTVFIEKFGSYVDNDIRSSASGTFGQIVIEAIDEHVFLMANSIVRSANNTGAFFPAYSLPPASLKSIAGIWEGSLTGTLINAQIKVTLFQNGTSLFGELDVLSGSFPTATKSLSISGFVMNDGSSDHYSLQVDDNNDSAVGAFSFSLNAPPTTTTKMEGKFIYSDEKNRRDTGTFSLSRTGDIFNF